MRCAPVSNPASRNYSSTGLLLAQTAGNAVNRRWTYDKAYNLRSLDDARWGTSHYQYNNNDQPVQAELRGIYPLLELFGYDENLNLNEQRVRERNDDVLPERISQMQQAGRVIRRGNSEYRYDSAGRLAEKRTDNTGFRPQVWRYRWDAHSRMNGLVTSDGERWHYAYDAFGRRISKRCETINRQKYTGYDYLWSGDQLIEETPVYADGTPAYDASIQWLYAPDALTPVARQEKGRLHYVVSDHMGTPRELLTEDGNVVWANRLNTWGRGNLWRRPAANDENVSCNLRFAGQYADEESGLHYNRHRYYDSETGQYLSSDPIGLAGGLNPYGYVHNPLRYVDPLGLAGAECCEAAIRLRRKLRALEKAQNEAVRSSVLPDGRIRYYNAESPAKTAGPTRGRSHVTEWDPSTGNVRSWEETYDHSGNVNRVHPKMNNGEILDLPHYPPTKADIDAGKVTPTGRRQN